MNVQEFLKQKGVAYELVPHAQAYTAQEVAAAEHVTGHKFAKTVIVEGERGAYMLVLPASRHADLQKASKLVGEAVHMAREERMQAIFPDCDTGAETPFGSQYGLKTYVDKCLADVDEIVFRAGTHDRTVKMRYADYARLEEPVVADFCAEQA